MGSRDRITIPGDLGKLARASERKFEATGSEVRRRLPTGAVPWLIVTYDELRSMALRPEDAFVLSLIDGRLTVEMIFDISGMPDDDTAAILAKLLTLGAIELHDPPGR